MEYGSFVNLVMARTRQPEPEVGMGATMLSWTDRHAGTVVEIVRYKSSGRINYIVVQSDEAIRTDKNGMSECQNYEYRRNPLGSTHRYVANRKTGKFKHLLLGHRDNYYDYSF